MANNLVNQNNNMALKKPSFSSFMATTGNKLVENTITDPKRKVQFIANVVSAVSSNPDLQKCDSVSVLSAALQADALHFPINNALGYVYLVPFAKKEYNPETKKREVVGYVAQFQIGYKGYIQLAIRSGQYKHINVVEVKEGELGSFNPLEGQTFNWIEDYEKRKNLKTIGYVARLELVNGFIQEEYMTYAGMLDHADTYSQAFSKTEYENYVKGNYNPKDEWKYSSYWYKNFDEMAKKTMIRRLLSKWGIMSVEMQEAYMKDTAEMKADGTYDYVDAKSAINAVEEKQDATMGTKPIEDVVVNNATGEVEDADSSDMDSLLNARIE